MCAKTTIMISPNLKENRIWLNGKEENFDNPRLLNCLKESKFCNSTYFVKYIYVNLQLKIEQE